MTATVIDARRAFKRRAYGVLADRVRTKRACRERAIDEFEQMFPEVMKDIWDNFYRYGGALKKSEQPREMIRQILTLAASRIAGTTWTYLHMPIKIGTGLGAIHFVDIPRRLTIPFHDFGSEDYE